MGNKYYLQDTTLEIRLALMKSMRVAKTTRMMANSLKLTASNIHHHLKALAKEGHVIQNDQMIEGKEFITYQTVNLEYMNRLQEQVDALKAVAVEKPNQHARVVKLQDKVYWTPKAKQHMEVRRGCTLSGI